MLNIVKGDSIAVVAADSDVLVFCECALKDDFELNLFLGHELNSVIRKSGRYSYVFLDFETAKISLEKDNWKYILQEFGERLFVFVGQSQLEEYTDIFSNDARMIKYPFTARTLFSSLYRKGETSSAGRTPSRSASGIAFSNIAEFDMVVGNSERIREIKEKILLVSDTDIPLIFFGESGTGKTMFAQIVHKLSRRKEHPFVHAMMGNGNKELVESKLFGNVRGAFTDARDRNGLFRQADGGTLFMDEIADLSLEAQAKILRVIETGVFRPVGSDEEVKVDVRLIFATNADLFRMVKLKTFREDLYWRIVDFPIHVPALRDRAADIPVLVEKTLAEVGARLNMDFKITNAALQKLCSCDWPGNFRQFRACIRRAALLSRHSKVIDQDSVVF